ncbi:MAG: hypothetical protein JO061_11140 [Acidobacteriaceae bacterium]|nr:hypothetical protein [Acidobacteriaceae bacterium]
MHKMYKSSLEIKDADGNQLVTSYAVHRPDGNWSVMLVNRDKEQAHTIRVVFNDGHKKLSFAGPVEWTTFGSEQYVWHDKGERSYADPDGPPAGHTVAGGAESTYTLPKAAITVLRGPVEAP